MNIRYHFYITIWGGVYATCSGAVLEERNISKDYRPCVLDYK